jgi:hypothetical protein
MYEGTTRIQRMVIAWSLLIGVDRSRRPGTGPGCPTTRAEAAGVPLGSRSAAGAGTMVGFGTELVTSAGGSLAALLGASPGASTAVATMLDVLPDRMPQWAAPGPAGSIGRDGPRLAVRDHACG